MSLFDEYAQSLATLEGDEFEAEVCTHLTISILGFQTVPAYPRGDGGLDGHSHDGTRGYCCYGPKHDEFKTNRQREAAIVKKFSSDLRWLFELEWTGTGKNQVLAHIENPELATILATGVKLKHITLVSSWFDSHRVIGPLNTNFLLYRAASKCRYVAPDATLTIIGPKEFASAYSVDELTVGRAQQRAFVKAVYAAAAALSISDQTDFDQKMELLKEIRPSHAALIDKLSIDLMEAWRVALAFEQRLDATTPHLHRALENTRKQILLRIADVLLLSDCWAHIGKVGATAHGLLREAFGSQYAELLPEVSQGEVARLIGECPFTWEKPTAGANGQA